MEPQEFDQELSDLEVNLERLRALYEQYFLGIERIEPAVARKAVDRRFWQLRRIKVRNTARRFRLQMLVQRYNTLQQHWTKICRQIENGTYVRHVQRARRRAGEAPPIAVALPRKDAADEARPSARAQNLQTAVDQQEPELAPVVPPSPHSPHPAIHSQEPTTKRISLAPLSAEVREKIRSSVPPAPVRRRPAPSTVESHKRTHHRGDKMSGSNTTQGDGISAERVGGLYQELQRVRRRLNQGEMEVSLDALSRSLRATEARLKAKYEGKRVDFRVEIHDGKAVIKPTVKR